MHLVLFGWFWCWIWDWSQWDCSLTFLSFINIWIWCSWNLFGQLIIISCVSYSTIGCISWNGYVISLVSSFANYPIRFFYWFYRLLKDSKSKAPKILFQCACVFIIKAVNSCCFQICRTLFYYLNGVLWKSLKEKIAIAIITSDNTKSKNDLTKKDLIKNDLTLKWLPFGRTELLLIVLNQIHEYWWV